MKFIPEGTTVLPNDELAAELAQARDVGKLRLGTRCLFYPRFAAVGYLPYQEVAQAYLRQEEVNANLCCGRASLDQFFLMIRPAEGAIKKAQVLSKQAGKDGLARIAEANPAVQIGYSAPAAPQR